MLIEKDDIALITKAQTLKVRLYKVTISRRLFFFICFIVGRKTDGKCPYEKRIQDSKVQGSRDKTRLSSI